MYACMVYLTQFSYEMYMCVSIYSYFLFFSVYNEIYSSIIYIHIHIR